MGSGMTYLGIRKNDHGIWVLDYYEWVTPASGSSICVLKCVPVTEELVARHKKDCLDQLDLIRECEANKGLPH